MTTEYDFFDHHLGGLLPPPGLISSEPCRPLDAPPPARGRLRRRGRRGLPHQLRRRRAQLERLARQWVSIPDLIDRHRKGVFQRAYK